MEVTGVVTYQYKSRPPIATWVKFIAADPMLLNAWTIFPPGVSLPSPANLVWGGTAQQMDLNSIPSHVLGERVEFLFECLSGPVVHDEIVLSECGTHLQIPNLSEPHSIPTIALLNEGRGWDAHIGSLARSPVLMSSI